MPRPIFTDDAEIAQYPQDVQDLIRRIRGEVEARFQRYADEYSHSVVSERGGVTHYAKDGAIFGDCPADFWFSLSYASWLTIPRVSLQEMPLDWQARFFSLLDEAEEHHGLEVPNGLSVVRKHKGKFVENSHWNNYRRGTKRHAIERDVALGFRRKDD